MLYFHGGVEYWVCLSKINDIMNDRYSKSTTETIRDICEKYKYRKLRKARFKIHHKR